MADAEVRACVRTCACVTITIYVFVPKAKQNSLIKMQARRFPWQMQRVTWNEQSQLKDIQRKQSHADNSHQCIRSPDPRFKGFPG